MRFQTFAPPPLYVDSPELVESSIRHCFDTRMLGVDSETIGLLKNPDTGRKYDNMTDQIVVAGLSPDDDTRYLVPRKYLHHYKDLLESPVPKALANVKFDAHRFANTSNILLGGPWADSVHLDFLLDEDTRENHHGLKDCCRDHLGIPMVEYTDLFGKMDPRLIVPGHEKWEKYLDYASLDPWATRKLVLFLLGQLSRIYVWQAEDQSTLDEEDRNYTLANLYWNTEEPQLKVLWEMERRGIYVDTTALGSIAATLNFEMEVIAADLNRMRGKPFNPGSGPQIGEWLFEDLKLPHEGKTPTGKYCTDEEVLSHLALGKYQCKEAALILQYKKAQKLKGTYAEALQKWRHIDGRVHTSFSATKVTGRLGSQDPNLQNIPTPQNDTYGLRAAFIPEPGRVFIVADYAQLEMRIMAAFAAEMYGDSTMLDAILAGTDMHSFTASRMMGVSYDEFIKLKKAGDPTAAALRTAAKSVGFGIIYGITKFALAAQLSETLGRYVSEDEAQGYIDLYLQTFPGIAAYMKDQQRRARVLGFVQTLCGRFRRLSKARSGHGGERGHAARQAINAPIQGSAADIVKRAMLLCAADPYLTDTLGFKILLQVHDELILEGPEEHANEAFIIIKSYMEHPFRKDLPVPLIADAKIVRTWAEAKG